MRRNTGLFGVERSTSRAAATGIFDLFDQQNRRIGDIWPAVPSYNSISPSSGSYNEGSGITWTVFTSDVINGTVLYFTIVSMGGSFDFNDFTDFSTTGSFTINNNNGSFSKTLSFDGTSEPNDAFKIQIRTGSTSGPVVLESGTFFILNPTFSVTPTSSSFNEGSSVTFNVNTTNVNSQTMYYTLTGISASDLTSGTTSGSFFLSGNFGSFTITAASDFTTEGNETLTCEIRINSQFGTVVATTSVVINDTSVSPTATVTVSTASQNEDGNPAGIGLISGNIYDATSLGAIESIDNLANDPGFSSLPAFGYIKYIISKAGGNETVHVAFKKSGTTISQSCFSLYSLTAGYTSSTSSILFYGNDDHDSLWMDADGRGQVARSNTNSFTQTQWDEFRGNTELILNSNLDTVSFYSAQSLISGYWSTVVTFPGSTSAIWINLQTSQYKVNNIAIAILPSSFTNVIGSGQPTNSLWTMSDGINQFMIGRYNTTSCLRVTVNLSTGNLTITSVTLTNTPFQANSTEEDCVGTQLFTIDGDFSWHAFGTFWYSSLVAGGWKADLGGLFNTSGRSNFSAGNSTQTDMDVFGSIDANGYVWFADWGHDDGGLFGLGNDSQLNTRPTNIRRVQPIAGSAGGGGGGAPSTDHIVTLTATLTPAYSGTYYFSTNVVSGTLTAQDFSDGTLTGSFTVTNGVGTFTRAASGDGLLEGSEQYSISVRQFSTSGTIIGTSPTITINDTSKPVTATVAASTTNVNEGGSVTFTVNFDSAVTGTYGWSTTVNSGSITANDFTDSLLSGTFSATSGSGSVVRTIRADATTEGSESFRLNVVSAGQVVGTSAVVTIGDTSLDPTASVSSASSVNEGSSITFTITTTDFPTGTLYWTYEAVSGTMQASDLSATSGSFSISGSSGNFSITPTADGYTEGAEQFRVRIRLNSTTGTIIGTSSNITINDTSTGGTEPTALYSFTSFTFTSGGVSGYTGPSLSTLLASYNTSLNPWLNNTSYFTMSVNGIQEWTVPQTGTYRILAVGGSGGIHGGSYFPAFPGAGAQIQADVSLTQGEKIYIVVGQRPTSTTSSPYNGAGGGGGTFLYRGASASAGIGGSELVMVAGGGGGTGHGSSGTTGGNGKGGSSTNNSNESGINESFGINPRTGGGSAGNFGISQGGRSSTVDSYGFGGGGAGWTGNGQDANNSTGRGGTRFIGGTSEDGDTMYGGFGGGGGSGGNGNSGGGGGGYTGGGGGNGWNNVRFGGGGGGGSFVIAGATNVTMTVGNSGINYADVANGYATITKL